MWKTGKNQGLRKSGLNSEAILSLVENAEKIISDFSLDQGHNGDRNQLSERCVQKLALSACVMLCVLPCWDEPATLCCVVHCSNCSPAFPPLTYSHFCISTISHRLKNLTLELSSHLSEDGALVVGDDIHLPRGSDLEERVSSPQLQLSGGRPPLADGRTGASLVCFVSCSIACVAGKLSGVVRERTRELSQLT